MDQSICNFLSIIAGGLITWLVASIFYRSAANDLKAEANELRKLNKIILESLENNGMVKLARNKNGEIISYHIVISGNTQKYGSKPIPGDIRTE